MEVEAPALPTTESKATEELATGNKAAEAEATAAEAKSIAGAAKKKKKKVLVKVPDDRISLLLANPPNLTLSHRLRSLTEEPIPFAFSNPERRRAILAKLPHYADLLDKRNEPELDMLRQYHETGCAFEEIEVDDEDN